MMRWVTLVSIAVLVATAVFLANLWIFVDTPAPGADTPQTVVVERGMPLSRLIAVLHERGVVGNTLLFKAYVVFSGVESKVRAGEYVFPPHPTPSDVLDLLLSGDFSTRRVTIPEGWNMREIAKLLGGLKLADADRLLAKASDPAFVASMGVPSTTLEGFLFPDTYEIYKPKNEEEILKKFVDHFKEIYAKEFDAKAKQIGMSEKDVVALASIVEKETAQKSERSLIAGVFLNRLRIGMPLATDPTIIYGIPNFNGNITKQDLQRPGPYNTYINVGLPPTPISNPGAEAIRAVLNPATTDYLYFVARGDGTHQFSRTEEEHNEAVRKYQIERRPLP